MTAPEKDDTNERPWEQAGSVRRDCDPHRTVVLKWLARASMYAGFVANLGLGVGYSGLATAIRGGEYIWSFGLVATLGSLTLAIVIWMLAQQDIARMKVGIMDPAGKKGLGEVQDRAILGAIFHVFALLFFAFLVFFEWGYFP